MPKIDLDKVKVKTGSNYPANLADEFKGRRQVAVGDAGGITQFGANIVTLLPNMRSSIRHWHEQQDELVIVLSGVLTLIDDHGETELKTGDCAAFPAGDANGHCIQNNSQSEGSFFVVGTRTSTETGWYSDVDMKVSAKDGVFEFTRKDGTPLNTTSIGETK